jgi:plasmid stabilization system protein ParE
VRIEILADAEADLVAGYRFYERQGPGLGSHFRDSLFADIDALSVHGGVHSKVFGYYRSLSRRFPFAIYYRVEADVVRIRAILDCRRKPSWLRRKVGDR